jgi:hypothetical protein
MQPIGLTFKDMTENPFTGRISGELMIVHRCVQCGRISCNRIAGDDNPDNVLSLLDEPIHPDTQNQLTRLGIGLLTPNDERNVLPILYGYGYQP